MKPDELKKYTIMYLVDGSYKVWATTDDFGEARNRHTDCMIANKNTMMVQKLITTSVIEPEIFQ